MFGKIIAAGLGMAAGYAYANYQASKKDAVNTEIDDDDYDLDEDEGEALDGDDDDNESVPIVDGLGVDSVGEE